MFSYVNKLEGLSVDQVTALHEQHVREGKLFKYTGPLDGHEVKNRLFYKQPVRARNGQLSGSSFLFRVHNLETNAVTINGVDISELIKRTNDRLRAVKNV